MLKDSEDAYGHEIYDYLKRGEGFEIVERDDGYFDISGGPEAYFSEYQDWPSHQREAMEYVRGRVLDIGCGAGRHSLYLQEKGHEVLGIDNSPLAAKTAKERGLKKVEVLGIDEITPDLGAFDTLLMMGNNFGLFGGPQRARRLLRRFRDLTSERGRIIADTRDIYEDAPHYHLEYHEFNRERGRMPGQVRIRIRYRKYVTPWFDYLMVSKEEMEGILEGTGWAVDRYVDGDEGLYIAVIDKK